MGYILDQMGHLWWSFLVWVVYLVPIQMDPIIHGAWYVDFRIPLFLLGLVLTTYVIETTIYLWTRLKDQVFVRNYRNMFYRGLIFTGLFLIYIFL